MTGTLPRRAAAALLLACACAAAGQARQIPPQDAPPIFRVEVDAVEIDAVVTNATGKQFAANDVAAIVHVGRGRASAAHLVAVLAGASLAAQSPSPFPAVPRDMTQKTAPAASAIRGRVVDAATGAPLRRVQVQVIEMSTPAEPATALTDDEGRYELGPLPAGRYQLQASKGGYVDMQYGQRRAFEQGRPIVLEEAQTLDRVDFALPRGAVLTGRVVDEAGEPVTGAYVQAGRYRYVDGNRRLTAERGDTTDDRGEYRIHGVPPGEYLLYASFGSQGRAARAGLRYVPTFYPGLPSPAGAQRLSVPLGGELAGLDLALVRAQAYAISGVVAPASGAPPPLAVAVFAQTLDDIAGSGPGVSTVGPAGAFTLNGLMPGRYLLRAQSLGDNAQAATEVVIESADVTGVTMQLSRGATARGRIVFEDEPPSDLAPSQVIILAAPADSRMRSFSDGRGPSRAREDWTFDVEGLQGRQQIFAATMGEWQVRRVLLAGRDVTDTPLDFSRPGAAGAVGAARFHAHARGRLVHHGRAEADSAVGQHLSVARLAPRHRLCRTMGL